MSDSDLTCQDLFQCGFISCTEVTSELHCFEMGLGHSSACVEEFVCVWESRCLSTVFRPCQREMRVCSCAQSACMWSHVFASSIACDMHAQSDMLVCHAAHVDCCLGGQIPAGVPVRPRADVNSPWGTLHLRVLLNPKLYSRCPRETD